MIDLEIDNRYILQGIHHQTVFGESRSLDEKSNNDISK